LSSVLSLCVVYLKVVGGEITSAAALAPKCGPLGMPPKKVGEDIQKATADWRGIKIQIEMMVQNRQCFITVLPTAAPLLIKALKEGPRDRKKQKNVKHNGNVKMDDVIDIAKKLRPKSMAVDFAGTVKEVLGTAVSLGCTVDGKNPKEVTKLIDDGEIEVHE
jgi:large subunit ribosomal protein L12e